MDLDTCETVSASDTIVFAPLRTKHRATTEAFEEAEMLHAYRRLSDADRAHILRLSRRLAAWHG